MSEKQEINNIKISEKYKDRFLSQNTKYKNPFNLKISEKKKKRGKMEIPAEYTITFVRLIIAALLAGVIGLERESRKISVKGTAGLRTHMLVAIGATLLTLISLYGFTQYATTDPGRIVSYIVMGIGFLGAGTIMALRGKVFGLTTAASIWLVAAIGIAVGLGLYFMALISTALGMIVLELWRIERNVGE